MFRISYPAAPWADETQRWVNQDQIRTWFLWFLENNPEFNQVSDPEEMIRILCQKEFKTFKVLSYFKFASWPKVDFSTKDTSTTGKLETITKIIEIISAFLNGDKFGGYLVGLPGCGSQCSRHQFEYRSYSFPDSKQIMVDRDPRVHGTQEDWAKEIKYSGEIWLGDIFTKIYELLHNGYQINGIDLDDVGYLTEDHEELITKASECDVDFILLTLTLRGSRGGFSGYLQQWLKKFEMGERRYVDRVRRFQMPFKDLQMRAIQQIAERNSYFPLFLPYRGKSPMMAAILLKNTDPIKIKRAKETYDSIKGESEIWIPNELFP